MADPPSSTNVFLPENWDQINPAPSGADLTAVT